MELSDEQLEQTVEDFLYAQSKQRSDALKRHVDKLAGDFAERAKRARTVLRDVANGRADTAPADSAAGASQQLDASAATIEALTDPFALVAIRGVHAGKVFKLEPVEKQQCWLVGRSDENDISLAGDDEVSSSHAKIIFERKQFKLQDSGSTNGTFATNGRGSTVKLKPRKNHVLKLDHLVSFGGSTFKWCYFADAEEVKASIAKI